MSWHASCIVSAPELMSFCPRDKNHRLNTELRRWFMTLSVGWGQNLDFIQLTLNLLWLLICVTSASLQSRKWVKLAVVCVSHELESSGFEPWQWQQIHLQNLQTSSWAHSPSYSLRTVFFLFGGWGGKVVTGVSLATRLDLVPGWRVNGAIPLLLQMSSWCGEGQLYVTLVRMWYIAHETAVCPNTHCSWNWGSPHC